MTVLPPGRLRVLSALSNAGPFPPELHDSHYRPSEFCLPPGLRMKSVKCQHTRASQGRRYRESPRQPAMGIPMPVPGAAESARGNWGWHSKSQIAGSQKVSASWLPCDLICRQ